MQGRQSRPASDTAFVKAAEPTSVVPVRSDFTSQIVLARPSFLAERAALLPGAWSNWKHQGPRYYLV